MNRLERLAGNIEPKQKFEGDSQEISNLQKIEKKIKRKEKIEQEKQGYNNQKNSLKYGDNVKIKLEAQKQIEGIKYDYQMLELLLDRNASNYTQKDKAKYNILIEE